MYRVLLFLLFPIFLFSQTKKYKVIKVKDGDTVSLLIDNKEETVRLSHIDCPEKKQDFGTKAKQVASDLCFGKYVSFRGKISRDRYQRILAELVLPNGRILNREMVRKGYAWHYKAYSKDKIYTELEEKARSQKIGLWADKHAVAPWEWRKNKKTNTQKMVAAK